MQAQFIRDPLFLHFKFFCLVETLYSVVWSGSLASLDWSGLTFWTIHGLSLAVEVFNIGEWLTHGDLVLEAQVDFVAVVDRVRVCGYSLGASLPGNAGVGVIRLRGAPVSLPTFATAQFKRFFFVVVRQLAITC